MTYGGSIGHVTDDVTWLRKVKVVTPLSLGPITLKMAGDTDLVTIEHLYEMAPAVSNSHVTGDVTWSKVKKIVTRYIWMQISRKPLEIEPRYQRIVNTKWHMANWLVTRQMTSRDVTWPRKVKVVTRICLWPFSRNGLRYRLPCNEAPTGNGTLGIIWSRDRWRHVTLKCQGCGPDIFG